MTTPLPATHRALAARYLALAGKARRYHRSSPRRWLTPGSLKAACTYWLMLTHQHAQAAPPLPR